MLFALLLLAASAADLVPMRWATTDPKALELLDGTPVNCLLAEPATWSEPMLSEARKRRLTVLGVIRPGAEAKRQAALASSLKLDGVVLEGIFEKGFITNPELTVISMVPRAAMRFDAGPVVATSQAVWPGIQAEDDGKAKAAPSGAPWINTNGGFLRFVRAAAPGTPVWLGNLPPANTIITPERYMQAIADAAIIGARWVIALDDNFRKRLEAREATAVRDWKKITAAAAWYEQQPEWRSMKPVSKLGIVQDVDSGALYSGGVLDMIAVKHTPVRAVPAHSLGPESVKGLSMAVDVDPSSLTDSQKATLAAMRKAGGSTLSGPATWKFPPVTSDRITLPEADVKMLDEIWKDMNHMTGRQNLGVRLFNVSSMLSSFIQSEDGSHTVLHLVNYSGFPVENVTVHLLAKYKKATLIAPGEKPRPLQLYDNDEGSGVDIDTVNIAAALLLE
ncbi:MAG: hypothetical protein SGI92_03815 [Bryobacteraceae bacterium]|nr:hypothetical protein [Bryobacteraceae bacterium]